MKCDRFGGTRIFQRRYGRGSPTNGNAMTNHTEARTPTTPDIRNLLAQVAPAKLGDLLAEICRIVAAETRNITQG